jgi:uncharacterized membrane protein
MKDKNVKLKVKMKKTIKLANGELEKENSSKSLMEKMKKRNNIRNLNLRR